VAHFEAVQAQVREGEIHVTFRLDAPAVVGWQLCDPSTGAHLFEGQWSEERDTSVNLRIEMPEDDGDYQVQVAPVADRSSFILIEAHITDGRVEVAAPRVSSAAAMRRTRLAKAIPKLFIFPVRSLWRNRKLMGSMVQRDILARYRGSFGGALWTFLNPLLLMLTYFFVFGVVLRARFGNDTSRSGFLLYFLAGMLPWLAFAEAVGRAPQVIVEHRTFVKKLVFPLETLPANLVLSGLVTEAFLLLIYLVVLLIARGAIPATSLWLPVLLVPQLLLALALGWFLAALGVYVRDLTQIVGFLLQLWFFLTPILYPESGIPAAAAPVLKLNPILILVRGYRAIFLERSPPPLEQLAWLAVGSAALAILSYAWFHRLRKNFADVI
jgi:lipopolysaccharide transport system permease protein